MFWGLIMEPNKRYTQTVEKPFHVSLAALDTSTGDNEVCQVMIVADKKNFLICTLQKGKIVQCPLNHYFKSGEVISFLTNGKCNVHLTGYLDPDIETDSELGSEDEEAPKLVAIQSKREKKRKLDTSGGEVAAASKKLKKEASKVVNGQSDSDSDSDEESATELARLLGEDVDSDDNDESFNPSTINDTVGSEDEEEDDSDDLRKHEEGGSSTEEEEEEEEEEEDEEVEAVKEEVVEPKKLSKSEKRKLKKQQKKQLQQSESPQQKQKTSQPQQTQQNGVEKKKAKKEQQQQQKGKEQNGQQETKASPVQREKKTLSGGVFIEDLKVGAGPAAKAGKVVQVYYEGRLKQNNKMFDQCSTGPGFKFRLGSKEVISGWDVGVAGMKVGGKRKIVCPPTMAYGQSGSPPVIPSNATLIFEVELKNVK